MFAQQHQHPTAFAAPVIGLAIASAAGMGGGEAESGDRTDLAQRAVVMAVPPVFGVIVVALPFFSCGARRPWSPCWCCAGAGAGTGNVDR
jgi:hypothetical protein